ncbi:hypothetical protein ACFLT8_06270 [Chloroflexota bacterium]
MEWEIVVAVILAIGIYTAVTEGRAKRISCRDKAEEAEAVPYTVDEKSVSKDGKKY